VGWSSRGLHARLGACVAVLALLAGTGCGSGTPGTAAAGGGCTTAPQAHAGSPLPFSLIDVSAVPGTRQAWALAGRYGDSFGAGNYLLHFSGLNWTKVASFGRDVHLKRVSAVSPSAAWVWGDEGRGTDWPTFRPFLALVSGGVVSRVRTGLLSGAGASAMASDGAADTWLAGDVRDVRGRFLRPLVARWDGKSWHEVPMPAGARTIFWLSTSGPSDAWAVVSKGFLGDQWLVHWDGTAWSKAYAPPASMAQDGRVPQQMSAASTPGHAWVAYTEAGTNSGSNGSNPPPRTISVYFDGSTWRRVPVPAIVDQGLGGLAEVTMSGPDAWAISAYKNINGILYSHLGSAWCVQRLPHAPRHLACFPTHISAASPSYVIAVTSQLSVPCRRSYAYVYDGRRWQSVSPQPAG
jgi:hypothetical protein